MVYGWSYYGFWQVSDVVISQEETDQAQKNLIMSHSCAVGRPLSVEIAIGVVMLLRVNNFANGLSGIRLSTVNVLIEMINNRIAPVIPEKGSLGSSGDLAPLSHMVLVMLGMGGPM